MKQIKNFLSRIIQEDSVIALFILGLFLLTNRYIYGWDDQHLEITLLKHLIDPTLYAGDYYVESLSRNFSSYLYPILSKTLSVEMIPMAYMILYGVVRFFMFFWLYKLWKHVSGGNRLAAFTATVSMFLLMRTEEFIYRTFSHQEFSLAIIVAGFYFFYKDRLLLTALLFGIAANFHALSALFPMMYLGVFAFFCIKDNYKTFFKTSGIFILCALPFLMWHLPHALSNQDLKPSSAEWIPLYFKSCPQCFPFYKTPVNEVLSNPFVLFERMYTYLFMIALYAAHCIFNEDFRRNAKNHVIFWVSSFLVVLCFIASYVHPNKFILDLNLLRTTQNVILILGGYTAIYAVKKVKEGPILIAFLSGLIFILITWLDSLTNIKNNFLYAWWVVGSLFPLLAFAFYYRNAPWIKKVYKFFIILPLLLTVIHYGSIHYRFVQAWTKGGGFWQLQRNWEDMQYFVKKNTPKDAMIFTPYNMEMGGFRIHSDRKVVVCYRDCGIIGFDFKATQEWQRRIKDVEEFKVFATGNILPSLMNAIQKYHADHIVFMNYNAPKIDVPFLKKLYSNEVFTLYKVIQ